MRIWLQDLRLNERVSGSSSARGRIAYPPSVDGDPELLEAWRDGDAAAGRRLFDRYFAIVCRFFRSKVEADADDLVQQTFVRCLTSRERLRDGNRFRAYLLAAARSVLIDYMRKRARSLEVGEASLSRAIDLEPSPSWLAGRKQDYRKLLDAIRTLPMDVQILLELTYWEELSSGELAEVLGVPATTIRSRVQRAREVLRERINERVVDPDEAEATFRGLESWANAMRAQLGPD